MTKLVSQLDSNNRFVGQVTADESPLEPGVFLYPAGTIDVEPPNIPEGKVAIWKSEEWVLEDIPAVQNTDTPLDTPQVQEVPFCDAWQIRKVLNALNLRDQVEALVSESTDRTLKDGWEFSTKFKADDPFVLQLAGNLNKSQEEVFEIIQYASTL